MQLGDLVEWDKENGPNKDMLADYIFLPDVNFSWKRVSKEEIMVINRSRECTLRVKEEADYNVILQHLCALQYITMNKDHLSDEIKVPIHERNEVIEILSVNGNEALHWHFGEKECQR